MEELWESQLQGVKCYGAYGPRDMLIIRSSESLEGRDIVPRRTGTLTQEDTDRLSSQGIPGECLGDDVRLMEARCRREGGRYTVLLPMESEGATRRGVMERIRSVMESTSKPGLSLHYVGPGKRHTGDWCFPDGFIEFSDLLEAYMEHFHQHSKCLEITADCSYSGRWVKACKEFLDGAGVQPCGHSARSAAILLKVRTSCSSHQIPHGLLYSARGRGNDKNTGTLYVQRNGYEVEQGQNICNIDNSVITCKKGFGFEDPCSLKEDYTWHKKGEAERVFLVRGKDGGRAAWHYVMVVDDDETLDAFRVEVKTGNLDLADYGSLIKSGWGKDPPTEVREWIDQKYDSNIH